MTVKKSVDLDGSFCAGTLILKELSCETLSSTNAVWRKVNAGGIKAGRINLYNVILPALMCNVPGEATMRLINMHHIKIDDYESALRKKTLLAQLKNYTELNIIENYWAITGVDLSRWEFIDCDLSRADFMSSKIDDVHFDGCTFADTFYGHNEVVKDATVAEPKPGAVNKLQNLRDMYFRFKQYFEEKQNYPQAGRFHKQELEIRAVQIAVERRTQNKGWRYKRASSLMLWLYKFTCDYGLSWTRALGVLFGWLAFIIFAVFFFIPDKKWVRGSFDMTQSSDWELVGSGLLTSLQNVIGSLMPTKVLNDMIIGDKNLLSKLTAVQQTIIGVNYFGVLILVTLVILCLRREFKR